MKKPSRSDCSDVGEGWMYTFLLVFVSDDEKDDKEKTNKKLIEMEMERPFGGSYRGTKGVEK